MKLKSVSAIAIVLMSLLSSNTSYALGTVSRACSFLYIPEGAKTIAAAFFYTLGADKSVFDLPSADPLTQYRHWILESLTTDYGDVRYYLFARRYLYRQGVKYSNGTADYFLMDNPRTSLDSQWTAEQISNMMKTDALWAQYFANRGMLYSARAGAPEIVEDLFFEFSTADLSNKNKNHFLVIGKHWYYDPVSKQVGQLADSKANNCNLGNGGFGFFDR